MVHLDPSIIEGVAIGNLKAISEQPAMYSNLAYANIVANTNLSMQNAVANQQAMNELGVAITGKTVNGVATLGPLEARSAVDILTNDEVAQTIADLKAAVTGLSSGGGGGVPHRDRVGSRGNPLRANGTYYARSPVEIITPDALDPNQVQVVKRADGRGNTIVEIRRV